MKIEIENYRGWLISFDTEQETFHCHNDSYDREEYKKSFSSTKQWVDNFIKENQDFKSFWVEKKPTAYWGYEKIKIIGIRKDNRFVYEDAKGEKKQLSDYEEKNYILYDESNEIYKIEANAIDVKIEELKKQRETILKNVVGVCLEKYKQEILQ